MNRMEFLITVLSVVYLSLCSGIAIAQEEGLVGYWKLDEGSGTTASDSSGYGNDGVLRGNASWTVGVWGAALDFDGSSNWISIPQDPSLDLSNAVTAMAWVRQSAFPYVGTILARWYDGTPIDRGIAFQIVNGSSIRWGVVSDANLRDIPYPFVTDTWYHVAATWDGSISRVYVNGEEIDNWPAAGTIINQDTVLAIGVDPCPQHNYFNGVIDEIRLYHQALSRYVIQEKYQDGILLGYWDFNDGSGLVARDCTGGGNDGTLIGGPSWTQGTAGSALDFDGFNDYVLIPENTSLDIVNSVTVMAWIYLHSTSNLGSILVRWYDGSEPDRGFAFQIFYGSAVRFGVISNAGLLNAPFTFETNTWYHVAAVWDGSISRVYVNGDKIDSLQVTGTFGNQDIDMGIGVDPNPLGKYFDGIIDDVRLYGYALTPSQIRDAIHFTINCGDANASGSVDIDDVVYVISYIFTGGPAPQPLESGDADCSGAIDIDDVVYLIAYIFSGGPEPCASCP